MKEKRLFVGCFNKSVILTYVGLAAAISGIFVTLMGGDIKAFFIANILLIVSGICDLFDGVVARKCKRNDTQKAFGIQIDSLVDVIAFLVFPATLLMKSLSGVTGYVGLVISIVYVICGVTRLAWFNITTDGNTKFYSGLPVTYSALIIPVFNLIVSFTLVQNLLGVLISQGIILMVLYVIIALLYILNVPIKKPGGIWYIVFSVLAIVVSGSFVFLCLK